VDLRVGCCLNELGRDYDLLLDDDEPRLVVVCIAVVAAGAHCYQLSVSIFVETINAVLVGSDDHSHCVSLEELVNPIWAKSHDVVALLRVSKSVGSDATVLLLVHRIAPEQVYHDLLLLSRYIQSDLNWSLDLLDVLHLHGSGSDAPVDAKYFVLVLLVVDHCSQWEPVEDLVDLGEHAAWVVDVIPKTPSALFSEAEKPVDIAVLLVASEKDDLVWVFDLQRHQEADHFEVVLASVHVVSQENVVKPLNVPAIARSLPYFKESH